MGEKEETIRSLLNEMKSAGINGALLRIDGTLVASTIALDEMGLQFLSSFSNTADALMKEAGDRQREIEITIDNLFLVIIPIGTYLLCGILKDREKKNTLREYAQKAATFL